MATVRQQVAAQIGTDNPTYRVDEYPNLAEQVERGRPYVNVYLTDLGHDGDRNLVHTLKIDCYASGTVGAAAEDEAETVRDDVLLSLQRMENVDWSTCQRSTFGDGPDFIGYQITATVTTKHVYANIVRQEQ